MAALIPNFDIVDTFVDDVQITANDYAQTAQAHATAAATHATAAQTHANHIAAVVPELKKYRNVAAPDLQAVMDRIDRMADAVMRRFDAIDDRFDTLDTKMQATYVIPRTSSLESMNS